MNSSEHHHPSRSPTEPGLFMSRKERGAIAAQTKIDDLAAKDGTPTVYAAAPAILSDADIGSIPTTSTSATSPTNSVIGSLYRYASSIDQMMDWPAFRQLMDSLDITASLNGVSIRRSIQDSTKRLPLDRIHGVGSTSSERLTVTLSYADVQSSLDGGGTSIRWDTIQRLSKAYFDTYNALHPILDREVFNASLHAVVNCGFGDDISSINVLLVLALGEVALAISTAIPLLIDKDHPPGFDGFTMDRPPGLAYFNEARKRMGFVFTDISLENVQMLSLAALFYDSCGRFVDCKMLSASASHACQALITSKPHELHGPQANLVRRNFWHCSIVELSLRMEFGLPSTGLDKLNETVGLPDLGSSDPNEQYVSNQTSSFRSQFASEVVLHQLCASFHSSLTSAFVSESSQLQGTIPSSPVDGGGSSSICKQLTAQLEHWRVMLPEYLQWQDEQTSLLTDQSSFALFTMGVGSQAATYPSVTDVQVALFRTQYYFNKYLIHRPSIFKVLHYPGSVTREDAEAAAKCLTSCLKWPITVSPPSLNKRLLPLTAVWSKNLFGVLVLLHLSRQHPVLARIRATFCGQQFEYDVTETLDLYIDWLRDMRKTDVVADRYWLVVKDLFNLEM
ncbi:acetate regulatory DNA binding [Paramyrothecium foliicola]|nr:acetate regulatory DNA binding [Paramyrothecium foliicola]